MTTLTLQPPIVEPRRALVRPWALGGPVLILLLCLPMLQPLRYPTELMPHQQQLIAMIRQNAAGKLAVSEAAPISLQAMTAPSPVFALLLSGPARLFTHNGLSWEENGTLMLYLLIAVGVTLPAALSAGLIYRMSRLFELPRAQRAALGLLCVAGSGLIAYATTLNAHAPAAALVIGASAATLYALRAPRARVGVRWTILAGFCAMLAAALDLAALPIALLMPLVFLAWRVHVAVRLLAVGLFFAGAIAPVALHHALHRGVSSAPFAELANQPPILALDETSGDHESGWIPWLGFHGERLADATIGQHGIFSHFPLLFFGLVGTMTLMHRHWPESIKWLAGATILAAASAIGVVVLSRVDFAEAAYATRWFIAFSPLILFWSGAWLRQTHGRAAWTAVAIAAALSVVVGMIGAARPLPPTGYRGHTGLSAIEHLAR